MRRVRLYFDKLSFDETVKVYKHLQDYINSGRTHSDSVQCAVNPDSLQKSNSQPTMDLDFSSVQVELSASPLLDHSVQNLRYSIVKLLFILINDTHTIYISSLTQKENAFNTQQSIVILAKSMAKQFTKKN